MAAPYDLRELVLVAAAAIWPTLTPEEQAAYPAALAAELQAAPARAAERLKASKTEVQNDKEKSGTKPTNRNLG